MFFRRENLVDAVNGKILQSPIYKALKSDFLHPSKQKRVLLLPLGKEFKKKVPKTAILDKTASKKKLKSLSK